MKLKKDLNPKWKSPVPPVKKASTPELTESPEVVAAMTVQLTTAKTETDALLGAIKEISDSLEGVDGQEGTSKLIKVVSTFKRETLFCSSDISLHQRKPTPHSRSNKAIGKPAH